MAMSQTQAMSPSRTRLEDGAVISPRESYVIRNGKVRVFQSEKVPWWVKTRRL
jgi:hypothetical protein